MRSEASETSRLVLRHASKRTCTHTHNNTPLNRGTAATPLLCLSHEPTLPLLSGDLFILKLCKWTCARALTVKRAKQPDTAWQHKQQQELLRVASELEVARKLIAK